MIKQFTIGRGDNCQIRIQDPTQRVSRSHATIKVLKNGRIFITDHSTNGTWVNGVKISQNVDYPVKRGDVISFANAAGLNWELIPRVVGSTKIYSFVALGIVVVAGLVWFISQGPTKPVKADKEKIFQVDSAVMRKKILREIEVQDSIRIADSARIAGEALKKAKGKEQLVSPKKMRSEQKSGSGKSGQDSVKKEKPVIYMN
ncbi:MAG: FHA domain-containing protein [Mangrovibacterium sp.]